MTKAREDPLGSVQPACVAFASGRRLQLGEDGSVCSIRVGAADSGRNAESFFSVLETWGGEGILVQTPLK